MKKQILSCLLSILLLANLCHGFVIIGGSSAGTGDVVGPAVSVDNTIPRFDSTTGKLLQGSGIVIDDSDAMTFNNAAAPSILSIAATATVPTLIPNKADLDTGIGWAAANGLSLISGATEGLRITQTPIAAGQTVASLTHTKTAVLGKDTTAEAAFTLNYTTNKLTSGIDHGLKINWTDTLSPATVSYPFDVQKGGTSILCVDGTNSRVGIGTTGPGAQLHIADGNSVAASLMSTDKLVISAQEIAPGLSIISADNDTVESRAVFKGVRSRGTLASPLVPSLDDDVLSFLGTIYDGVNTEGTAMIGFKVDGAVSSDVAPQRIGFFTSETTGTNRLERLTIKSSGNVGIGTTSPTSRIHGVTTLSAATGDEVAYQLNYTTNKLTSGNDTGLLVNQTDTLSPGTSLLADFQVGGTSKFFLYNDGVGYFASHIIAINGFKSNSVFSTQDSSNKTMLLHNVSFTVSDNAIEMAYGTFSGAGVTQNAVVIMPTYNQTTTSSGTDLLINRTETAVGSGAQYLTQTQVGSANMEMLTNKGHHVVDDAVAASYPALTSCGTSPTLTAGSNDYAGTFVIGATGTGCTITFGTAYTNAPSCVCSGSAAITNTQTNAVLTVVAVAGTYNYHCVGLNGGI